MKKITINALKWMDSVLDKVYEPFSMDSEQVICEAESRYRVGVIDSKKYAYDISRLNERLEDTKQEKDLAIKKLIESQNKNDQMGLIISELQKDSVKEKIAFSDGLKCFNDENIMMRKHCKRLFSLSLVLTAYCIFISVLYIFHIIA